MNGWFWRVADPLLIRIRARLQHLETFDPPRELAMRYAPSAVFGPTVKFIPNAEVVNWGPRENLTIGEYSHIAGQLGINRPGGRLSIGGHSFVGPQSRIWAIDEIKIGNFVLISHLVDIHDNDSHSLEAALRRQDPIDLFERKRPVDFKNVASAPIRIEDDVWIGFKCTILKGVTIGRGAIVAAASLVTKDVEPFTLVAGNPARVVRTLDASVVT
jgi:acetyltransferase-like isoleucine patch superfamily enzyme